MIRVVGGGLAGCEAAWQAASQGVPVVLYEMRPVRPTPVHKTDCLGELVCSNSFRGDKLDNAVGLLKEELRRLGSLVMQTAETCRIPAGSALAVDRERFATAITEAVSRHPLVTVERKEITTIPDSSEREPVIIATGPLTSDTLSSAIVGLVGAEYLCFYDAISPIVLVDTIDNSKVFRASRWDRSLGPRRTPRAAFGDGDQAEPDRRDLGAPDMTGNERRGDYLNCPLTREDYERFHEALIRAESATLHDLDTAAFYEGCLPIEVMARRGLDTLRFGPMKPVGLIDPHTGRQPYAAVQLRQDNLAGDHYSVVGFQTQLKWSEQARVLRLIPGLERAEFVRYGMVHRNTYINGPAILRDTWQTRTRPDLFFAGQVSGVEGYVESAASGLVAGINAAALARGEEPEAPPRTTAIGALGYYVSHAEPLGYQPTNITFGIMESLERATGSRPRRRLRRAERNLALAERALKDLDGWIRAAEQAGKPWHEGARQSEP